MKTAVRVSYADGEWQVRCPRHGLWALSTRAEALERAKRHSEQEGRQLEILDPSAVRVPPRPQEPREEPIRREAAAGEPASASFRRIAVAESALEGVPLPAGRSRLLDYARRQHLDGETMRALERLPEREYGSLDELGETLLPVQPHPQRPEQRPREESGAVPGLDSYLTPHPTPGDIRQTDVEKLHGAGKHAGRHVV